MTAQELYNRFQQRLTAVGGECHLLDNLEAAARVISAHDALAEKELVIPPDFSERRPWYALLPILRDMGISIREAGRPASVADAPAGLSSAELAIGATGSVFLAENALEAR